MPLRNIGSVDIFFHSWDLLEITSNRAGEYGVKIDPQDFYHHLPDAIGHFDSQDEFDSTINWREIYRKKIFSGFISERELMESSLKNYVRSLESQQRALSVFKSMKEKSFDFVIAARPDVKFLHDLTVPIVKPDEIYIPTFHSWGGVNDRFALGREDEIAIWLDKRQFALNIIKKGLRCNPEKIASEWLLNNKLTVKDLNFVFQRVRANGDIQLIDRDLAENSDERGLKNQ